MDSDDANEYETKRTRSCEETSSNDGSPSSCIESMTQACIEWDESKNLDLRTLTNDTKIETSTACSSINNNPQPARDIEEIGIVSMIKNVDEESCTPRKNNVTRRIQQNDVTPKQESYCLVGRRKRWRRDGSVVQGQQMINHNNFNDNNVPLKRFPSRSKRQYQKMKESSTNVVGVETTSAVEQNGSNDFAELLDCFKKTPSPPTKENNVDDIGGQQLQFQDIDIKWGVLSPIPHTKSPSRSFRSGIISERVNDNVKPCRQTSNDIAKIHTTCDKENIYPKEGNNKIIAPTTFTEVNKILATKVPDLGIKQNYTHSASTSTSQKVENNKVNQINNSSGQPQDEFSDFSYEDIMKIDSLLNISNNTSAAVEAQVKITRENDDNDNDNDNDEFGDFDLSFADLESIDSLVEAALTQRSYSEVNESDASNIIAPSFNYSTTTTNNNVVSHHTTHQQQQQRQQHDCTSSSIIRTTTKPENEFDDEFPDFDDINFDDIDKSIAERVALTQSLQHHHDVPDINNRNVNNNNLDGNFPRYHIPSMNELVMNKQSILYESSDLTQLCYSRYKVLRVDDDISSCTKTLVVAYWSINMLNNFGKEKNFGNLRDESNNKMKHSVAGVIHLRGIWCDTRINVDDDINICSLTGRFRTDPGALPIILHTYPPQGSINDDLVLIVDPDQLLTPTTISENCSCTRRAILKNWLGSSALTSKAALFGTMRHQIFEQVMTEKDFSETKMTANVKDIIRKNAEGILACNSSSNEAEQELMKVNRQLITFANTYTIFGPRSSFSKSPITLESQAGGNSRTTFVADSVEAVEEPLISPELGLKGNVDMIMNARTGQYNSIQQNHNFISVELKTGHNQKTQNAHLAQLNLYIIMMQCRYGSSITKTKQNSEAAASKDGILLYLNNDEIRAVQVAPTLADMKNLIVQRNVVATEQARMNNTNKSIDVVRNENGNITSGNLETTKIEPRPPQLPEVLPNSFSCQKCYLNRECMLHARLTLATNDDQNSRDSVARTHNDLLSKFTGHLVSEDFLYYNKWTSLLDLEAEAGRFQISETWLHHSYEREASTSKTITALVFDDTKSSDYAHYDESWYSIITMMRSPTAKLQTPLAKLGFENGSRIVVSTDFHTSNDDLSCNSNTKNNVGRRLVQRKMYIVRGIVHSTSDKSIQILASKDDHLRMRKISGINARMASSETTVFFRIDKDETAYGIGSLRQNLVNLLTGDVKESSLEVPTTTYSAKHRFSWLRDILVRFQSPIFQEDMSRSMFHPQSLITNGLSDRYIKGLELEFLQLNPDQKAAVVKTFTAKDFSIIQGMPGTGKTSTISFVARLFAAHGKRVLVTSYTHAAVDALFLKLIEKEKSICSKDCGFPSLVRIGTKSSCHSAVLPYLATNLAAAYEKAKTGAKSGQFKPSAEALHKIVSSAHIVGITALSCPRSPLVFGQHFDVVIVDEAGQITQPTAIGPLLSADSFVLVGDHKQLPPLVKSEAASNGGFDVSFMQALAEKHPQAVAQLTLQYRMKKDICRLSSILAYDGKLKCANNEIAHKCLDLPGYKARNVTNAKAWLHECINPDFSVTFLDTDLLKMDMVNSDCSKEFQDLEHTSDRRAGGSIINSTEALIVQKTVGELLSCGLHHSHIGVISPFRSQIRILEECESLNEWKRHGLEISTIDRYQGREKNVIIISFVRSNAKAKVGKLLEDFRRLNVALSRAKWKLIMIGSFTTLFKGSTVLKPVLEMIQNNNWVIQLPSNALE